MWISLLTTLITLAISFPVALYIARAPKRWRSTLIFLVMIPFWTNFLVRTYALQFLIRANGPINTLLLGLGVVSEPLSILSTPAAVLIGLVYGELPFMILPILPFRVCSGEGHRCATPSGAVLVLFTR